MTETRPGHYVSITNLDDDDAPDLSGLVTNVDVVRGLGGYLISARVTIELDLES